MVRRKKSLLFSASLASAGLVAGGLFMIAPKTQASSDEVAISNTANAVIQEISRDSGISTKGVETALKTHELIVNIPNLDVFKESHPDAIKYTKIAEKVYVVEFADYNATSANYLDIKEKDNNSGVLLNMQLKLDDDAESNAIYNYEELNRCTDRSATTYTNGTSIPDQCLGWGTSAMKLDTYAKSLTSGQKVTVAVIDSGIRASHWAFKKTTTGDRLDMTYAHDYYDNDTNPDDSGNNANDNMTVTCNITTQTCTNVSAGASRVTHGTSVAGTITQATPASVKIVPIRVSGGKSIDLTKVAMAVSELKGKVDVINLSLGLVEQLPNPLPEDYQTTIELALREAKEAGTIIVASAGNGSAGWVSYPASSNYTIAVSSVNNAKSFSSSFSQHGAEIDFAAPGEELLLPTSSTGADNTLTLTNGTSFSAPYISAAIANILTEHPNYDYNQVYNTLKLNAEDLGVAGKDEYYGWGSVSFHVNKYADLSISTPAVTAATNWTNSDATIKATASSNAYNINKYKVDNGNTPATTPSSWSTISSSSKSYNLSQTVSANGTYTLWFKNSNNETASKTVTVNNIDKTEPVISTALSTSNVTANGATLNIGVTDSASGLGRIIWHYKANDASSYTDKAETYASSNTGETSAITKSLVLTGLNESTRYAAYATVYDVAGNAKDSETIYFTTRAAGDPLVPVTSITVSPATANVNVGATLSLTATVTPTNSTDTITWSSSDSSVATVDVNGVVKGVKAGTVTITAKANDNVSNTATITVKAATTTVPATAISINPVSISINVGEKATPTVTLTPANSTDTITWSSSDSSVATVSSTGKIVAVKAGTATITATANSNVSANITVTVLGGANNDPAVPTEPTEPKDVNVKNPKTADINAPAIASVGGILGALAFFIFRAKRR